MEFEWMYDVPSPTSRVDFLFCHWEMTALVVEAKGVFYAGFILS